MHRRKLTVLALAAVAVAAIGLTGASAASGQQSRFQTIAGGSVSLSNSPLAGLSNTPVKYILELSARPVAVVDAARKSAGRSPFSMRQKMALTRQIAAKQAPVIAAVRQISGASIGLRFQGVYNGFSVTLPQSEAWKLSSISGVKAVYATHNYKMDVSPGDGIPLVNGPQTWGGTGKYTGAGIKIADIDTGLDYTHADFGGTGTTAAFSCAHAHGDDSSTVTTTEAQAKADFAANCPGVSNWYSGTKVKGGTDLVGDAYNASAPSGSPALTPHPDYNPLDCNGHGSHTAGTMAGFGVDHNGQTYTQAPGSYNANTINNESFIIPPGVAPQADLYAVRVFGCSGSVNDDVLLEAMNWSFNNGMDVVNMSLGSSFGSPTDPDSVAADNLASSGVITVLSSGNSGPSPYMTGSPASGLGALSTAANDSTQSFPGADLSLSTGTNLTGANGAIVANGATVTPGVYTLKVLFSAPNVISNGCRNTSTGANQLPDNSLPPGTILVIARGTCARVAKAIFAQQEGAVGVIMVNNSSGFPPYEGPITADPDAAGPPLWGGFPYTVTIPFFGVKGGSNPSNSANGAALRAADGGTVTVAANGGIVNAAYLKLASFSSWGPTAGGILKPEVTAPGVSIISAGVGAGNGGAFLSGTSMAAPHATGTAALVKQAHPGWGDVQFYKDAISNTANPALVANYQIRGAGAGEIDAYNATHTHCVADGDPAGTSALSFGLEDQTGHYTATKLITLHNFTSSACDFKMSVTNKQGVHHSIRVFGGNSNAPLKIRVPAFGTKTVSVQLDVLRTNAADPVKAWNDCGPGGISACVYDDAAGLIRFKALNGSNHGIGLIVPYYAVPTLVSNVAVEGLTQAAFGGGTTDSNVRLVNPDGGIGYADWFSWGGSSPVAASDQGSADLLNAGIQSYPGSGLFVFGLQTTKAWTNPAEDEFDVYIDVNADNVPDYKVVSADFGALQGTTVNGEAVVAVFSLATGNGVVNFDTPAMFNGTTMELPVLFSDLCQASTPCATSGTAIRYVVKSFDRNGGADSIGHIDGPLEPSPGHITSSASTYDIFHPSVSTANGSSDTVLHNGIVPDEVSINQAAWTANPQLGILTLFQNNQNTVGEAATFSLSF